MWLPHIYMYICKYANMHILVYACMWCTCVLCVHIPAGTTSSASLPTGPWDMEWQQLHLCQDAGSHMIYFHRIIFIMYKVYSNLCFLSSLTIHVRSPVPRKGIKKGSKCLMTACFGGVRPVFQEHISLSEPMPLEATI